MNSDSGARAVVALEPKSVATFYEEVTAALRELDIHAEINPSPNEVDPAIPFAEDEQHSLEFGQYLLPLDDDKLDAERRRMLESLSGFVGC